MPLWYINLPWFTELVFFFCLDFVHIFIFVVCYSKEEEETLNTSFSHPLTHNREIFFFLPGYKKRLVSLEYHRVVVIVFLSLSLPLFLFHTL